jgi:hypothetical protein
MLSTDGGGEMFSRKTPTGIRNGTAKNSPFISQIHPPNFIERMLTTELIVTCLQGIIGVMKFPSIEVSHRQKGSEWLATK